MHKRTFLRTAFAAAGTATLPGLSWAQKFAFATPLSVILPLQAGSASDVAVRYVTTAMGTRMNLNFAVENIPGAGGVVGLQKLAGSKPDGQTVAALNNSILTILPHLQPQKRQGRHAGRLCARSSGNRQYPDVFQRAGQFADSHHQGSGGARPQGAGPRHLFLRRRRQPATPGPPRCSTPLPASSFPTYPTRVPARQRWLSRPVRSRSCRSHFRVALPFLGDKRVRLIAYCGSERHPAYTDLPHPAGRKVWPATTTRPGSACSCARKRRRPRWPNCVVLPGRSSATPASRSNSPVAGLDPWPRTPVATDTDRQGRLRQVAKTSFGTPTSRAPDVMESDNPIRLAGYQGPASILSASVAVAGGPSWKRILTVRLSRPTSTSPAGVSRRHRCLPASIEAQGNFVTSRPAIWWPQYPNWPPSTCRLQ